MNNNHCSGVFKLKQLSKSDTGLARLLDEFC